MAISLSNRCAGQSISVAICYRDMFNSSTSQGWYNLEFGQTRANVVEARGADVYFFGASADMVWQGRNGNLVKRDVPIQVGESLILPGNKLFAQGHPVVSFFGRKIDSGEAAYTEIFTCAGRGTDASPAVTRWQMWNL